MTTRIETFAEFYRYYLSEHRNGTCRALHVFGSTSVVLLLISALATQTWWLLVTLPVAGYGPAWVGHFVFEKNKPASWTYPWWSFMSDWVMMRDIYTGRIPMFGELPERYYSAGPA